MYKYIVRGGKRLKGEAFVSGSKNASLPILAAAILNGKITKLYNVPEIEDTKITLQILKELGCKVKKYKNKEIELHYIPNRIHNRRLHDTLNVQNIINSKGAIFE